MSRNGSGTYTLPAGNPVVTGTTIESNWANTTLSDIATTLTDSLSRSGQGGMTAALRIADGTQGAPGVGFANETGSGFYRAGTGEVWAVVQGAQTLNLDATGVTVPADKATSIEGTFVFNETGADKDARFEGDTDANLLFTDASTDRVGVGTNAPTAKLDVNGTAAISGNVTLSGGTANGVLYLDGSKVATSGSALTFDGTNLGLQATPSAWSTTTSVFENPSGSIYTFSGNNQIGINSNAYYNGTNWIYRNASSVPAADYFLQNGQFVWRNAVAGTSGNTITFSEQMRLTSTGLGIGTSSPGAKVHAYDTSNSKVLSQTTTGYAQFQASSSSGDFHIAIDNSTGAGFGAGAYSRLLYSTGVYPMVFFTNATERMRLDSSGNLGIGTNAPQQKLEVYGGIRVTGSATLSAAQGAGLMSFEAPIMRCYVGDGTGYSWAFSKRAASVTTDLMTLNDSGNLGLGVTPSAWGTNLRTIDIGFGTALTNANSTTDTWLSSNAYYTTQWLYKNAAEASYYQQASGAHRWYTAPSGTAGNAISFTQAMTLFASGALHLGGTADPGSVGQLRATGAIGWSQMGDGAFQANRSDGMYLIQQANGPMVFSTNNTERARITSGGDLLVGTTSVAGAGGITLQAISNGFALVNNNNTGATGYVFSSYRRSSTEIGSITQNGTTAVLFNTTSDRRLKANIVPAPSASDVIDAIEIVSHDWKAAPDEHVTYGVIAQDLALVAPQAVLQGDDGDEIEKTWGVDYSKLVPMLIKELQSLRARVAALEAA